MLYNLEAEQSVIAAVLLDNDCLEIFTRLKPEHFYTPAHRIIYKAICYLATKNVAIDLVTLSERLKSTGELENVGGNEYLASLIEIVPSSVNFRHYVAILRKDETLRRLQRAAADITKSLTKPDEKQKHFMEDSQAAVQYAERLIFDISKEQERKELTKLSNELPTVLNNFDLVAHDPSALRGIKTGYTVLDSITNGLQKGSLIIIGARPSVGKTSFAMNIVLNAALGESKAKVAIFSLEMSKVELVNRAICSVARVSLSHALQIKVLSNNKSSSFTSFFFLSASAFSLSFLSLSNIFISERFPSPKPSKPENRFATSVPLPSQKNLLWFIRTLHRSNTIKY